MNPILVKLLQIWHNSVRTTTSSSFLRTCCCMGGLRPPDPPVRGLRPLTTPKLNSTCSKSGKWGFALSFSLIWSMLCCKFTPILPPRFARTTGLVWSGELRPPEPPANVSKFPFGEWKMFHFLCIIGLFLTFIKIADKYVHLGRKHWKKVKENKTKKYTTKEIFLLKNG